MFQLNTLKRKTEMKVVVDIMLGRIKRKRIFRQTNMECFLKNIKREVRENEC